MAQLRVKAIELETIASSTLTGSYQAINPAGLPQACFLVELVNGSNQAVTISLDGSTDNLVVLAASSKPYPTPINTLINSRGALWPKGTIFYAKGTAGSGDIAVCGLYQEQP